MGETVSRCPVEGQLDDSTNERQNLNIKKRSMGKTIFRFNPPPSVLCMGDREIQFVAAVGVQRTKEKSDRQSQNSHPTTGICIALHLSATHGYLCGRSSRSLQSQDGHFT